MAGEFSREYIRLSEQRLRNTPLYFAMRLAPYIAKLRSLQRSLYRTDRPASSAACSITRQLEDESSHFRSHQWAFVKGMLDSSFHRELVDHWPKRFFLDPPRKITKSYDTGFRWTFGQNNAPLFIDRYPAILKFFNYLRSEELSKRVSQFVSADIDFTCYSFVLNMTRTGSEVIPHKDGIYNNPLATHFFNMVFLINGTGGKDSGGLMLSHDSELKDPIIEPENLFNTCLIYDSKADFYHGFRAVQRGKFRWAINAQFCEKSVAGQI